MDGDKRKRVAESMMHGRLTLRPVQGQDCKLIWTLANDPSVRTYSFSSEFIPWNEHVRWFKSKLNDPYCIFYIAMNESGVPIGQIRFDKNVSQIVTSVSITNQFRGRGHGSLIIKLASQKYFQVSDAQTIHAYVKKGNEASKRAFLKAGFRKMGRTVIHEQQAIHFVLRKGEMAS